MPGGRGSPKAPEESYVTMQTAGGTEEGILSVIFPFLFYSSLLVFFGRLRVWKKPMGQETPGPCGVWKLKDQAVFCLGGALRPEGG